MAQVESKLCCDCIHYLHGQLENPCAKGMRCVGYLNKGCWRWETEKSDKGIPTKKCSICGKVKEVTEFVYDKGRYAHYCRACRAAYKESRSRKKNKL